MDTTTTNNLTGDAASNTIASQAAQTAVATFNALALNSAAAGNTAPGTPGNPIVTVSENASTTQNYTPLLIGGIVVYFLIKKGIL